MTFDELEEHRAWFDLSRDEMAELLGLSIVLYEIWCCSGITPPEIDAHIKTLKRLNPDALVSVINDVRENR